MQNRVVIIGGGASGIAAAISAARAGAKVTIIDHQDKIAKKILLTGNGKCNLTNLDMSDSHYVVSSPNDLEFLKHILGEYTPEYLIDFFDSLGLRTVVLRNSYIYPEAEAGATVVQVLLRALNKLGVRIEADCHVKNIKKSDTCFCIITNKGQIEADSIILACGGMSYKKTGSDGSGYDILKALGVKIRTPYPALTAITSDHKGQKLLSGLRQNASIALFDENSNTIIKNEYGQVQFTDYGISGIPVFQISSYVYPYLRNHKNAKLSVLIDLYPEYSKNEVSDLFFKYIKQFSDFVFEEGFAGFLHKKWISYFSNKYSLNNVKCKNINPDIINKILRDCKCINFPVKVLKGFDFCQVTGGGVSLQDISDDCQLIEKPGIFVIGELLDITGDCGGYNLHFAFSTGILAGNSAAKRVKG